MTSPVVLHTVEELNHWRSAQGHARVALVPTMGALHEGHLQLVRRGREVADLVIVSIFVNPRQFGANEDFDKYPRTLEADVAQLEGLADAIFAPSVDQMYPADEDVPLQHAGPVGDLFEGASRPGHFDGMLTVVSRLFAVVKPDIAIFGQKDAQQVFLVSRMITEQHLPLELVVVHTVREADGLALSSRNRFLTEDERSQAVALPHALLAAARQATHGNAGEIRHTGREAFEHYPLVRLDYLDVVDPTSFMPVPDDYRGPATIVVAAVVGTTRLIDTENLERIPA